MSSRIRWIAVAVGLALLLLVGGVSANRLSDDEAATETTATAPVEPDPYPLATGTTPDEVQLLIYERAFSECASTELPALAAKYKAAADASPEGVAAAVGRGWASYFKAGPDAVPDGRDGCLQGQDQRSK